MLPNLDIAAFGEILRISPLIPQSLIAQLFHPIMGVVSKDSTFHFSSQHLLLGMGSSINKEIFFLNTITCVHRKDRR